MRSKEYYTLTEIKNLKKGDFFRFSPEDSLKTRMMEVTETTEEKILYKSSRKNSAFEQKADDTTIYYYPNWKNHD